MKTYAPGDKVRVDHPKYPGVWTVERVNRVNSVLVPEGGGKRLRAPQSMLRDPDWEPPANVTTFPATQYSLGEIVRVGGKYAGLYVVIKDSGTDKVNLAKLGGDGDRYLRMPKTGSITRVDPSEVLK